MATDREAILSIVRQELPRIIEHDAEVRHALVRSLAPASVLESLARVDGALEELRRDREEQSRRWGEDAKRWDENAKRWDEEKKADQARWGEDAKRWAENTKRWDQERKADQARWDEDAKRWAENTKRWDQERKADQARWAEDAKRWDEERKADQARWAEQKQEDRERWDKVHEEIMAGDLRLQSSISAIGARWGMQSESAWRNGLRGVLEDTFSVKVENVVEFDAAGEVFGRADQVELDVVINDGRMVLIELRSSMSRSDMYVFERKVRFYERLKGRSADRRVVISPMIDSRAAEIARSYGIECFTHSLDLASL